LNREEICVLQEHTDDILSVAFLAPNMIATGSYNGEIIVWNSVSEMPSRRLFARAKHLTTISLQLPKPTDSSSAAEVYIAVILINYKL